MAIYIYTRTFSDGEWNINNPNDVDGDGNPVTLAERIYQDETIGSKLHGVYLNSEAKVEMTEELSPGDKTILDNIVATHEAASGTINKTTYCQFTSENGTNYLAYVDDAGDLQVIAA